MLNNNEYDIFFSHSSLDHPQIEPILKLLQKKGLRIWYDDTELLDYEEITKSIELGLANSKILLSFYSQNYPQSRACQYELTSALIAAHRIGNRPNRILVINPEQTYDHIHPVELRDQSQPNCYFISGDLDTLVDIISERVHRINTKFGEILNRQTIRWYGKTGLGSRRFVGRIPTMWSIHSALHASSFYFISKTHAPPIVQIIGMGGIGKSLIAEEYALWFATSFPGGIFWLNAFGNNEEKNASTPEDREAERIRQFLNIAVQYGIIAENKKTDEIIAEFNNQIAQRNLPFLWIVDDIPIGMTRFELEKWFAPTGSQGRTLITTRTSSYNFLGTSLDLNPLESDEALILLEKWRKPISSEEKTAAKKITMLLGCHPLALDVAGSHLERSISKTPFTSFERDLTDQTSDALELGKELVGLLPTGHEASIAKTFLISINQMDEEGKDFLRLASILASAPIHGSLVSKVFLEVDSLNEKAGIQRAEKGISQATMLSLAKCEGDSPPSWTVHPLISRTMRFTADRVDRNKQLRTAAVTAHIAALKRVRDERIHRELNPVLPHARELIINSEDLPTCELMGLIAKFDDSEGAYRSAESLYRSELKIRKMLQGERNPYTLGTMNNLAGVLCEQGNFTDARKFQEHVLKISKETHGDEHPLTVVTMNSLAMTLHYQGDLIGARSLQEKVLILNKKHSGMEHPHTLVTMDNLSAILADQGDFVNARKLQEQVLEIRKKTVGEEHPSTIIVLDNLAQTIKKQGDLTTARRFQEELVKKCKLIFGDDHPHTLTAMNNLADTLRVQGDLIRAQILQEKVMERMKIVFGEEHPKTLTAMNNLSLTLHSQRNFKGALKLLEHVFIVSKKNLGENHPDTLSAMNNLGDLLRETGDLDRARTLQEELLVRTTNILGDEHPLTMTAMSNLALSLQSLGDIINARKLLEKVVKNNKNIFGTVHPTTIISMKNYADLLCDQGDFTNAQNLQEEILETSGKIYGEEHKVTLAIMDDLVKTYRKQGHVIHAMKLQRQIKKIRRNKLHTKTKKSY